jgi:Family of unknown function (DUF6334)
MNCNDLSVDIFFQEDLGYLSKVSYIFNKYLVYDPIAILMYFDEVIIMVKVVEEDDSVELMSLDLDQASEFKSIDVSNDIRWKDVINVNLRWVWSLTNQQGYTDGIQFEWADPSSNQSTIIQAIAIASCFRFYKVEQFR